MYILPSEANFAPRGRPNYLGSNNGRSLFLYKVGELYKFGFFRQGVHGAIVVENDGCLGSFEDMIRSLWNAFVNLFRFSI